jgi:two-component sensor histidine kinase
LKNYRYIKALILVTLFLMTSESNMMAQIHSENKFLKYFNSQSYAGKVNIVDTLKGNLKLKYYPLVKNELQIIKEKAIADNKTDVLDKLLCIEGEMYYLNKNYYKCIPIFVDLFAKHKIKNYKDSSKVFSLLKKSYIKTRALNKAIEVHKVLAALKAKHPDIDQWEMNPYLSTIYYEMKLYNECLKQQLLEYDDMKGDGSTLLGYYNNRGLYWNKYNNQDSAIACFEIAKKIFYNTHAHKKLRPYDEFVIGLIDGNIGQSFMALNEYQKAIPLLKKDVRSSVAVKDFNNAAISQLELSRCYLNLNQLDLSKQYLDSVNTLLPSINDYKLKLNTLKQYADYYHRSGSLNESILFYNKYINTKDSLDNQESMKELIATQVAYQMEEKEKLIATNQLKIKEESIEITKQQSIKNVLLISGILLVLVILLVLFQLKKTNHQKQLLELRNKQIETRNEIINKSLLEKDLLIKEVHHRVKNNLQIVSSLLKLQAAKSNNEEIKISLQEAHDRINSMALLHQMLYRNNEMTSLSFDAYLTSLINQISSSFSSEDKSIIIESNLIALELDLDTAIPLGLITNELLSNAYKHAFSGKDGVVKIQLMKLAKNTYQLKIADNGKGLPDNFNDVITDSLGLDIVNILSDQISAELKVYNDNGASFEIIFKVQLF